MAQTFTFQTTNCNKKLLPGISNQAISCDFKPEHKMRKKIQENCETFEKLNFIIVLSFAGFFKFINKTYHFCIISFNPIR